VYLSRCSGDAIVDLGGSLGRSKVRGAC
jgi:hypothetical protein